MRDQNEMWKEVERLQIVLRETVSQKGSTSPEAVRAIQSFRTKMKEYNDFVKQ